MGLVGTSRKSPCSVIIIIITSFQTNNHTSTLSLNFYRPGALPDVQPCQNTEGKVWWFTKTKIDKAKVYCPS